MLKKDNMTSQEKNGKKFQKKLKILSEKWFVPVNKGFKQIKLLSIHGFRKMLE
jgi:hypothetical protein